MTDIQSARDEFLETAFWYGPIEAAKKVLDEHPDIASDFYVAAALGDHETVRRFIAADGAVATRAGGPRNADALTYLCFSRFLAHDASRSDGFVRAATALLDAGADPNGGFFDATHTPKPERESVLYGAAGVAHHAGLTRLLLERGADPNDAEVPYHSPETYENAAFKALLDSGKMGHWGLNTMLLRKSDWHDLDGVRMALDAGANPNDQSFWKRTALHHAVLSDNNLPIIDLLLDRGADPTIVANDLNHGGPSREGMTVSALAAWRGRGDVLDSLEKRGVSLGLSGADALAAAVSRGNAEEAQRIAREQPQALETVRARAGMILCEFAGNDNAKGIAVLLDLGLPIDARYRHKDGYFDVTPETTALLNGAWRAAHDTVELLVKRGADVNAVDGRGRTPLVQAVRAATDSYWTRRRSPRSVKALLEAGARKDGLRLPTGYEEIDKLL